MRIDRLGRLSDAELTSVARRAGVLVLVPAVLLALKATEAPGDVWGGWHFLTYVVLYGPSAALIFFSTQRLREPEEQSSAYTFLVGALLAGFVVVAAVAVAETGERAIFLGTLQRGAWAVVDLARSALTSVGVLVLLTMTAPSWLRYRVRAAMFAAVAFVVATLAIELRSLDHPFLSDGWEVVSFVPLLVRTPVLLLAAGYFPAVPSWLRNVVCLAAAFAVIAAVAYGLKTTEFTPASAWWIPVSTVTSALGGVLMLAAVGRVLSPRAVVAGAIVVGLATVAWSGYVFVDMFDDGGEPFWFLVITVLSLLTMLVPPVLFSEVGRRLDERRVLEAV